MNNYIFYGSKEHFQSKIPKVYRTLTDLVMELDVSKMLVQIEGYEQPKRTRKKWMWKILLLVLKNMQVFENMSY